MENLSLCSKILYDRDLLQTKKELYNLKDPTVVFTTYSGYELIKELFYKNINHIVFTSVNESNNNHMRHWGLSDSKIGDICDTISKLLTEFTKNKEWSETVAFEHVYILIKGLFHSFVQSNIWELIINTEPKNISKMIYQNIYWYFENRIFSKIISFKCTLCKKNTDYLDEITNVCYNCSFFYKNKNT